MKIAISELEASQILGVSASTMVTYRRKGIVPEQLFESKKYVSGIMRYRYDREALMLWMKTYNLTVEDNIGI